MIVLLRLVLTQHLGYFGNYNIFLFGISVEHSFMFFQVIFPERKQYFTESM